MSEQSASQIRNANFRNYQTNPLYRQNVNNRASTLSGISARLINSPLLNVVTTPLTQDAFVDSILRSDDTQSGMMPMTLPRIHQ